MAPDDDASHASMLSQLFQLQERFDEDPSIVNYVALRRFAPGYDTEVFLFAGLDPFGALGQELEKAALDRVLVCGALGGNDRDIDELCLQLMERLIERKQLEVMGATHLQSRGRCVSDALVNCLIVSMVEVLQQDGMDPKPSLVLLVREQLNGANAEILKSATKSDGKRRAVFLGMQLRRRGEQPTIRKIAEIMGVQPSTVSRWFTDGDYLEQVERLEKSFVTF